MGRNFLVFKTNTSELTNMNAAVCHHLRPAIVGRSQFRVVNGALLMPRTDYARSIYRSIARSVYIKCEDVSCCDASLIAVLSIADE